jgi:ribosomal protein L40E
MRNFIMGLSALGLIASSVPAISATQCRDAKGKFIKCPPKAAPAKATKCRDAKGKFAKCGTKGAKPA